MPRPKRLDLTESRFTRATGRKVLKSAEKAGLFTPGEGVIVAVSGGQDSTALLLILHRLGDRLPLALTVAHFDHHLRTRREARADLQYVHALAERLELTVADGERDVRATARREKLSLEDAARRARFAFFEFAADATGAATIALGHTRDDRAETVLLHLLRGAGAVGIAAMPALAPWPFGEGPRIVRPLLDLPREDTLRYCQESGIEPRSDPSNDLPVATRNRVRHKLMPLLRTFNPRIDEALVRLAGVTASDALVLNAIAGSEYDRLVTKRGGRVRLDRGELASLPEAIASRIVIKAAAEAGGDSPSAQQLEAVLATIANPPAQTSLPGNVMATASRKWLEFERQA
jgi:tRNA(Ile)-lysidine synthase